MSIVEITLDADVDGDVTPAVPAQIDGDPDSCDPGCGASVENLRITLVVPARCIGSVSPAGMVRVDVTELVQRMDREAAEDVLIDGVRA